MYLTNLKTQTKYNKTSRRHKKIFEKTIRKQRSDKTHNIKFPVSDIEKMILQSLCKQTKRILLMQQGKDPIQQTKLNTLLLVYGHRNQHILSWDWSYRDTKQYMHTNIL